MALELVFTCPGTLKKLRSSPLGKLLDGFCDWLLEHGFARYTVRKHLSNVSHLNEHLSTLFHKFDDVFAHAALASICSCAWIFERSTWRS